MALRLSGRFKVMVAICPATSRVSVEYISRTLLSIHEWSMSVSCANLVRHFEHLYQPCRLDAWISPCFKQRRKHVLCRDIADQIISGKRAPAKPGQGTVKAPATRLISRKDFLFCVRRAAV